MNRYLNNEGQECKTGHVQGRLILEGRVNKKVNEGEYG
jgi:hypothetical protein